jgi:hypothetical protein
MLPPQIKQCFIPVRSSQPDGATLLYRPALLGFADVYYQDTRTAVDTSEHYTFTATRGADGKIDWSEGARVDLTTNDLDSDPQPDATFANVPDYAANPKNYVTWAKQLVDVVLRTQRFELFKSPKYGLISKSGESERDFRVRLDVAAREARDAAADKLRQKYAPKLQMMQDRLRRAQQAVDREKAQARTSGFQTAVSLGSTILGAFLGKKKVSAGTVGKATTTARGVGRSQKEYSDVGRAEETVEAVMAQQAELDAQFQTELKAMESSFDPANEPLETVQVRPKKSNITIESVTLAWTPYWRAADGTTTSAWE